MTIFSYTSDEFPAFLEALQRENERLLAHDLELQADLTTARATCARLQEDIETKNETIVEQIQRLKLHISEVVIARRERDQRHAETISTQAQVATLTAQLAASEKLLIHRTKDLGQQIDEKVRLIMRLYEAVGARSFNEGEERGKQLVATVATLTAALRRYGQHTEECAWIELKTGKEYSPCTCGFDAVLRAASEDHV